MASDEQSSSDPDIASNELSVQSFIGPEDLTAYCEPNCNPGFRKHVLCSKCTCAIRRWRLRQQRSQQPMRQHLHVSASEERFASLAVIILADVWRYAISLGLTLY